MKKLMLSLVLVLLARGVQAGACSDADLEQKVLSAALYLETLNGGGRPLTQEVYSLSSRRDTYSIILSYSGVQHIWQVTADPSKCTVSSVIQQ